MASPETRQFACGPFRGVRYTSEPFDDRPDMLNQAVNLYLPDPLNGCAAYSRPGFEWYIEDTNGNAPNGFHLHVGTNGTAYNFAFAGGKLFRNADGPVSQGFVDVTPANVDIDASAPVYAVSLGDSIIVNDGVNPPWIGTNLGSTPITGANIVFSGGNEVALVMASMMNTQIGWNPVTVYVDGVAYPLSNNELLGEPLPAGSIPANKWGVYRVSYTIPPSGAYNVVAGDANYTTGYDTEAAAIAALPELPADSGDMGYFTVRAAAGAAFLAGTSALAGGTGGVPAQNTNYYAPYAAWSAYGPPVIYAGSVFFICNTVGNGLPARTTIAWSEPNLPAVGYQQDDYDNVWELTQTGSDPLYALAPTNDALYYSRQNSWGALAGTPNINFQNTATHDVVSGNIGCIAPRTVQVFLNYVYFADAQGRAYRFANGGTPEPLWTQLRQFYDEERTFLTAEGIEDEAYAIIEPNLNVYLLNVPNASSPNKWLVFDAMSGVYAGYWGIGGVSAVEADEASFAGIWCNAPSVVGGGDRVLVIRAGNAINTGDPAIAYLSIREQDIWGDTPNTDEQTTMFVTATGPWWGYALKQKYQMNELRSLVAGATATTDALDVSGILSAFETTQSATGLLSNAVTPPLDAVSVQPSRYIRQTNHQVFGRGARAVVAWYTDSQQVLLYRIEAEGVGSLTTIRDR